MYHLSLFSSSREFHFEITGVDLDLPKLVCFGDLITVDYFLNRAVPKFAVNYENDAIKEVILPCLCTLTDDCDIINLGCCITSLGETIPYDGGLNKVVEYLKLLCDDFNKDHVIPIYVLSSLDD